MTASDSPAADEPTDESERGTDGNGNENGNVEPATDERTGEANVGTRTSDRQHQDGLERVRTDSTVHAVALFVAVAVGLALSWLHWLGLIVGGALVGLVSATPKRAVLGGLGFGVLVLAVFAATLGDSAVVAAETTPIVYVAVGAALGLPVFGSLIRLVR
ncbi:hypothetical protein CHINAEXTREME_17760 [Halobiforma lacisalsi AJ5]|uniref:Uncharacterized protein n=1 Tax=Natronobacterium lacisalsi AJ5 TaxID=358396 RepID=M0LDG0_NATLA|nr:hypothetical protein [Halobiforma lacisalsi]APW99499.1 hypothetical protein CHINAEXTREME_17760 [Halobiforma lacisalsi AJ5]EMA31621.1 hypothetical protein C445_14102 [Halobiforma lacisalsi AJ5]